MTELLVCGVAIVAAGPFQGVEDDAEDEIKNADGIFPKHVLEGWQTVQAELPPDFTFASYEWHGELVRKAGDGKSEEELREEFKIRRAAAVAAIVVDVDGLPFDGDEVAQGRMARAILAMNAAGAASTVWVLANNEPTSVTLEQLSHALVLAGLEQSRLWVEA